nr:zona pellucida sperm-binding protein 4-like [Chrysemys picta bellii]
MAQKVVSSSSDAEGRPQALQSNPACGTRVEQHANGSMVVEAFYTGCYVNERDGSFVMTVQIEGPVASYKEELRCPNHLLARDAPSPSVCSAVQASARLPCAAPPTTQGDCEELGCCYQPGDRLTPCYYGDKGEQRLSSARLLLHGGGGQGSPGKWLQQRLPLPAEMLHGSSPVTAQCTPDGQFSVAISRDVTVPPLDLSSVHLVSAHGSRCAPVSRNEAFVVYRFPLSACGTTVQASGDQRVYENELVADRQVLTSRSGSITRDSTFRLTIRCSYSAEDFLPVNVVVSTLPPPPPAVGQGPLALEMRLATDEHYGTYYADREYPVVKFLRDPVHVEVRILQRTDPSLALVLHQCWATPSTNPLQQPEWPILVEGCPYEGDNYQTQLVPVSEASGLQFPSHHQRFIVSTFTFVDTTSQRALSGPLGGEHLSGQKILI